MFEELRKELRSQMNNIADDMITGMCQDYPTYQRLVGQIEGLAIAERMIIDVLEKIDQID